MLKSRKIHSGSQISNMNGKWEEYGTDLTPDQEWPKTASVEVKMLSTK